MSDSRALSASTNTDNHVLSIKTFAFDNPIVTGLINYKVNVGQNNGVLSEDISFDDDTGRILLTFQGEWVSPGERMCLVLDIL